MNRQFGKPAGVWFTVFLALGKAVVPAAAIGLFLYAAYTSKEYVVLAVVALFALFLLINFVHGEVERSVFYPAELSDGNLMLLWDYLGARRVFDIEHISGVKRVWVFLYFRHLGWPRVFYSTQINRSELSELATSIEMLGAGTRP